jgi:hypothetical protein
VGIHGELQGTSLVEISPEDNAAPIVKGTTTNFLPARTIACHLVEQRSGAILMISATATWSKAALRHPLAMSGFGVRMRLSRRPASRPRRRDCQRAGRLPAVTVGRIAWTSSAEVLRRTRLATNPVAAVPANLAVPSHVPQPVLQCLGVHKVLHDPELPAVS